MFHGNNKVVETIYTSYKYILITYIPNTAKLTILDTLADNFVSIVSV
jgi:hypothetical protein